MKKLMIQTSCYEFFRPFFIPVLFLLAACNRAVSATPVAVPAPTMTIEATEVEIETETAVPAVPTRYSSRTPTPVEGTLIAFDPNEPTVTSFPTRLSATSTSTPDLNPFPDVPLLSNEASQYNLQPPDPNILMDVLIMALKETANYEFFHMGGYSPFEDARATFDFLDSYQDFYQIYNPENAIQTISNTSLRLDGLSFYSTFTPTSLRDALQVGLVQFLNLNNVDFSVSPHPNFSEFNYLTAPVNLISNDPEPEWLIQVTFP